MKKIFLSVCILGLMWGKAAIAKDGPFPMYEALGEWMAPDNNLRVEVSISKFDGKNPVLLVVARTGEADPAKRGLVGSGLVTYIPNDDDPRLIVEMKNSSNESLTLILTSRKKRTLEGIEKLEMTVTIVKTGVEDKNFPTSLVKVH